MNPSISLRPLHMEDVDRLTLIANDKRIANTLRDVFPHPYSRSDGKNYISFVQSQVPPLNLGILYEDLLVGICGGNELSDVHRYTAEIGYWLGVDYWGQGIATQALSLLIDHYFNYTEYVRLQANVYSNNPSSNRVLEKNGFTLEGIMRKYIFKNGTFLDASLYALLKEDWNP